MKDSSIPEKRRHSLHKHANNHPVHNACHLPLTTVSRLLLTLGYMAGIYWLSSIPGETDPENPLLSGIILWTPPAIQNLAHIPLFALLAFLWHWTLSAWVINSRLLSGSAFLLTAGYGILDEWHQLHVPGRYASFTDITLNVLGAAMAIWLLSGSAQRHKSA